MVLVVLVEYIKLPFSGGKALNDEKSAKPEVLIYSFF